MLPDIILVRRGARDIIDVRMATEKTENTETDIAKEEAKSLDFSSKTLCLCVFVAYIRVFLHHKDTQTQRNSVFSDKRRID